MIKAMLDGKQLSAEECIILLVFKHIFNDHTKIHACANWAVNVSASNPFVKRNSIVTVMYNFSGFTIFCELAALWFRIGVTKHDLAKLKEVIEQGLKTGMQFHGNIGDLAGFSDVVDFVIKVRNNFMNEFAEHKKDFPGIEGEALFIGTVLHSLDHTLLDETLEDPLWLDVDHPEFGVMAEIGRISKAGFTSDLPGVMFEKRFKDAPHPFYQNVYQHAVRINRKLADNMDTCIIK